MNAHTDRGKVDNVANAFACNALTDNFRITNCNKSESPIVDRLLPSYSKTLKDYTALNEFSNLGKSVLPTDPLILDLNGDGIRLSGYNDNKQLSVVDLPAE
ncbi:MULTISPECIES: hypothetical protein [Pasteurellaceae]|uniref:Uncharacterized protein n=1 Tax=Pasteurella atlantica TaxID=2827233 RepID=A0AAW8CFV5_9PAST|nr:hypothetical protein [Pasteurella atlantica]MBR0573829.1 hypothetical protein [Pasteurella atlantica]MDP8039764.1 hypothetical protein [Pasteurella atlantica]MDP8041949.1 hypothetical protein [Pasteurella atlantica]MDP8044026.1 hypothetical protein [Pasteurella atlantica]MDP8046004.1 hypothetical protein [Pasteurella atlantica]